MKTVKSLLLGSAAGLVAVAGAQAADLPVKAKAVEYVKVCAAYGAGYYYIPGTDTCLKIGGYARADFYGNAIGTFNPNIRGQNYNDTTNTLNTRARGVVDLDARTQTEYGTLRSYVRFGAEYNTGQFSGTNSTGLYFERAFIQFAGLTAGYTQSFFDSGVNYFFTTPYAKSDKWTTLLGYTAEFGNGFSASVSLEDGVNRVTSITNAYAGSGGDTLGGSQVPDIVGNLRLAQSWGTLMVSGAAHQARIAEWIGAPISSWDGSSDKWGWAVQGFAQFNLPFLAAGDSIFFTAAYADGAINYAGLSGSSQGVNNALGRINDGALYRLSDVVWDGAGYSTMSAWSLSGQFRHYWTPGLRSAVYAGYVSVDAPSSTVAQSNGFMDFDFWQVGFNTIWSPVKNLDIGAEVLYSKVDGSTPYNLATNPGTGGSTDVWSGGVRVQRNF